MTFNQHSRNKNRKKKTDALRLKSTITIGLYCVGFRTGRKWHTKKKPILLNYSKQQKCDENRSSGFLFNNSNAQGS